MVATDTLGVDLWRASELTRDVDRGRLQQAALGQSIQQGSEALVEAGELFRLEGVEPVVVGIPATAGDCDEPNSRLDQSHPQQTVQAELRLAELGCRFGVLLADVERLARPGRGDHRVGLLREPVEAVEQLAVLLKPGERRVEAVQQTPAAFRRRRRSDHCQRDPANAERLSGGGSLARGQRSVLHSQITPALVLAFGIETEVGRSAGPPSSFATTAE